MGYFAVIDTETNWADQVMSIGVVVAHSVTMEPLEAKYYILPQEAEIGGMYYEALFLETPVRAETHTRQEAMEALDAWLSGWNVRDIYAYNANFDRNHLPELGAFQWFDIMRLAAYRQYNACIPACADCFSTGRLKRGYGVEPMLRLLSGRDHQVMTGLTVLRGERAIVHTEVTDIHFRELTDREIDAYVATGEPMDKAGAYGIQGGAALFCQRMVGDYYNVMGLPVCRLTQLLKEVAPELMEDQQ